MDSTSALQEFTHFDRAYLDDLPEFRVGHAVNEEAATGCTVVLALDGAVCSVDVCGGGPATRETDLLKPENMVEKIHGVVLSGGSAFGLEAATGGMQELAKRKVGFELCGLYVPIVVGACLFDLPYGKPVHTSADGDTIFTMTSGKVSASFDLVAVMATEAMQGAILRAVCTAHQACGLPAASDLRPDLCATILNSLE